jgi:hypothetical protein
MIDEEKIGVMGHSMGAVTSLEATAKDSRIKAVVSLAPGYFNFISLSRSYLKAAESVTVPTQIISGSEDVICPPSHGRKYYDALPCEKEILIIKGASHDLGILNPWATSTWLHSTSEPSYSGENHLRNTTGRYFISWFNYHLRDGINFSNIYGQEAWFDLECGILSDLQIRRQYSIIVVDDNSNPLTETEVTIFDQNSTVLLRMLTDSFGRIDFYISLTRLNYTEIFYLEVINGESTHSEEISFINFHPQLKVLIIPEFSISVLLILIFLLGTASMMVYKLRILKKLGFNTKILFSI